MQVRDACEKRGARGARDKMGGEGIILTQEAGDKTPVSPWENDGFSSKWLEEFPWRFSFVSLRQGLTTLAQV